MKKLKERIAEWLVKVKILAFPRSIAAKIIDHALLVQKAIIVYYDDDDKEMDAKVFDLIRQIKEGPGMMMKYHEAYQLFYAVKRSEKTEGDLAEVGARSGGSSKLISEAGGGRPLYVFDTFDDGLPDPEAVDDVSTNPNLEIYKEGMYATPFESVKKVLAPYPNTHVYKGLFPDSAGPIKDKRFAFVNLDVDLYESTSACLKFFYPRLNKGAVLISHDYTYIPGVTKAFDEFFKDKPESIGRLLGSQCMIVKL